MLPGSVSCCYGYVGRILVAGRGLGVSRLIFGLACLSWLVGVGFLLGVSCSSPVALGFAIRLGLLGWVVCLCVAGGVVVGGGLVVLSFFVGLMW